MKVIGLLLFAFAILSEPAIAQFNDQGFIKAVVRTDYNSQTEGQSSNPLTFVSPCLFPGQLCGTGPTIYNATNSFAQNTLGYPQSSFWVLDFNNETSYNQVCPSNPDPGACSPGQLLFTANPGPANQSLPRAAPGFGLMGFTALIDSGAGETFYRAHMVMNGTFPNPQFAGTPYMSIGAESNRGNNGVAPGFLNYTPGNKRVQFTAKLWDFKLPTPVGTLQPATLEFYLLARTRWGGKGRGLFITLAHWNFDNSTSSTFEKKFKWNWPMQESFYHPGVEWAFIDAEDVQPMCGFSIPRLTTKGQQIAYDINLRSLFQCISNKSGWDTAMPTSGTLPISGVHWSNEMSGANGALWTSVHNMKMVQ